MTTAMMINTSEPATRLSLSCKPHKKWLEVLKCHRWHKRIRSKYLQKLVQVSLKSMIKMDPLRHETSQIKTFTKKLATTLPVLNCFKPIA